MENSLQSAVMRMSPLNDNDFSDLTKTEILRWAKKLNISPDELYSLPQRDLEQMLKAYLAREKSCVVDESYIAKVEEELLRIRQRRRSRWLRLRAMRDVIVQNKGARLKGGGSGDKRNLWDILAGAALEIEALYSMRSNLNAKANQTNQQPISRQSGGDIGQHTSPNALCESRASSSTDPCPPTASILKTSPANKPRNSVTQTSGEFDNNKFNQCQQQLCVTFSQDGIDGGPCFVQETSNNNSVTTMNEPSKCEAYCNLIQNPNNTDYMRKFLMTERDGPVYRPSSPIRKRDYPTFMQGVHAATPQRYEPYPRDGGR